MMISLERLQEIVTTEDVSRAEAGEMASDLLLLRNVFIAADNLEGGWSWDKLNQAMDEYRSAKSNAKRD